MRLAGSYYPISDRTCALCSGSAVLTTGCQGSPPLSFLMILILSCSLYNLLQCTPLHRNYFLKRLSLISLCLTDGLRLFLRHILQYLVMFDVTNHPLLKFSHPLASLIHYLKASPISLMPLLSLSPRDS